MVLRKASEVAQEIVDAATGPYGSYPAIAGEITADRLAIVERLRELGDDLLEAYPSPTHELIQGALRCVENNLVDEIREAAEEAGK